MQTILQLQLQQSHSCTPHSAGQCSQPATSNYNKKITNHCLLSAGSTDLAVVWSAVMSSLMKMATASKSTHIL